MRGPFTVFSNWYPYGGINPSLYSVLVFGANDGTFNSDPSTISKSTNQGIGIISYTAPTGTATVSSVQISIYTTS